MKNKTAVQIIITVCMKNKTAYVYSARKQNSSKAYLWIYTAIGRNDSLSGGTLILTDTTSCMHVSNCIILSSESGRRQGQ